jgi:outer membrane protein assembly factor BamB
MDGVSKETSLPVSWDKEKNITWRLAMPDVTGSTPIIWGDQIFLHVAEGGKLWLWSVDRNKGEPVWKKQIADGDVRVRKGNMSSPSPVTDGKTVWVLTGNGIVKAFDFAGNELWARDLQKDVVKFGLNHGYGSSPLLFRDGLYIQILHGYKTDDPSYVIRLDTKTGRTVWKVERPTDAIVESPDSYTTPAIAWKDGKAQLIVTGGDYVTGHDLNSGAELWRAGGMNPRNNPMNRIIASPLVMDDLVVVPTRVSPMQVFRTFGSGTVTDSHLVWATPNGPDVPTPVSDGKLLYMVNDRGIVYCFDAKTGKEVYGGQRIKPAIYSSSPVLADGKIYISNEEGLTTVIKAGPTFEVLAENPLDDYILSSPAVSDGQIFIRTKGHLYCIGQRRSGNKPATAAR